ncbi:unnamed protein product [Paramecium octaurelia]|uniref:Uncharacterized protein n=1 Tax=Paramecium octaurelia TaxID=43137 RepID=A0A8S1UCQ4_PAROT|nr:unnamed protein product [Paramecium octaurelia]
MSLQLEKHIKQEMKKNCFQKVCPIEISQLPVTSVYHHQNKQLIFYNRLPALKNQLQIQMTQIGLV